MMKLLYWTTAILLMTTPAFAQDEGAFGGLFGGDVGLSAPSAAPRGAPAAARGAAPPALDRLVRLKDALLKANAPLSKEQETAINALLDAEIPAMRKSLLAKANELGVRPAVPAMPPRGLPPTSTPSGQPPAQAPTPAPARPPAPQAAAGATPPAGSVSPRGSPASLPALDLKTETTLRRFIIGLQDQLLSKVASAPSMKPEQQSILKGLYRDQLRARGGLDAIQIALEDAGTPFTPEQMSQIQPIFDEQDLARAQLQQESQGAPPDPARVGQMEQATMLKVLRLMTPAQRTALQVVSRPRQ
jgi:hypothetical protein